MRFDPVLSRRTLLAAGLASAAAPRAFGQTSITATVPLTADFPHLAVPARIGGKDVLVALDNGAEATLIDQAYAPRGRGQAAEIVLHPQVRVTSRNFGHLSGVSMTDGRPTAAIIGMELFRAWTTDFDFGARTLTLTRGPFAGPPPGGLPISLTPVLDAKNTVQIMVEDKPLRAFLDLGCSWALLVSPAAAERLGLTPRRLPSTNLASGLGPQGRRVDFVTKTGSLSTLKFGERVFTDVPVEVADMSYTGLQVDGLVGLPLLRKYDLRLDLVYNDFWVHETPRLAEPFERRLIGAQAEPVDGGLRVYHVAKASPAERAGLKAEDVIAAVDGAPASLQALRAASPGQKLALRLATGAVRTVTARRYD